MSLLLLQSSRRYLLDRVQDASVAYALHRLKRSYQDGVIRVRRDNDDEETDVDLRGNYLTLQSQVSAGGTFEDWVGANSAYIAKWYSQSQNDADQTTSTAQPRIVNSGTLDVDSNGRAQMVYDGTDDALENAEQILSGNSDFSIFTAWEDTRGANSNRYAAVSIGTGTTRTGVDIGASSDDYNVGVVGVADLNQSTEASGRIVQSFTKNALNYAYYEDGQEADTFTDSSNMNFGSGLLIGQRYSGGAYIQGNEQAIIVYARDLGAQRSIVERELNQALEIY